MIFTTQHVSEAYWKVRFDHPPVNVFDGEFSRQLMVLIDELEANEQLKVVVFESANPEFFVAHAELINFGDYPKGPGKTGLSVAWPDIAKRLEQAPFVSIAAIRGRARGLGSEFAQAFDMRFASQEKAIFSQPEVGIGSFPGGGGLERLHLLTGRARALEILLSGDDYDATTAAAYGWVNRALPDAELDAHVERLARRIASFDQQAITVIKASINARATLPHDDQILESQTRFFQSLATWPTTQARIKKLLDQGLQHYGDVELNLGQYL